MKILKIFGIVVGIHVFALILIFANPGCSSTTQPAPSPTDTVAQTTPPPNLTAPASSPGVYTSPSDTALISPAPAAFNPDAPAVAASVASSSSSNSVRFTPTRPNTPVASTLVNEPVSDVTPATTYTVKSGDSLWSVAKKNHLTVAQLTAANSLSANANLRPGQKLLIPKSGSTTAAAAPAPAASPTAKKTDAATSPSAARSSDSVKHTVKSGETLGSIARTYGVRQGDIAVANNISDPAKIKAGMELTIPGWQTPSGKSGKAQKSGANSAKSREPKTPPPAVEPEQPAEQPATVMPPPVPVIRLDDSPITPAPKP